MEEFKDKKRNAWITVLFLFGIILAFSVADLFNEVRTFSESENRVLQEKPKFTLESLFAGDFTEDYENYLNDQFVGRDTWIRMKTRMDLMLQRKLINGVYLAEDDYLIEQHTDADFPQEQIDKKLALLKGLVDQYPQTQVMLVPTADNILSDKLPSFAPYFDDTKLLARVKETIGEEHVIDVYDTLKEHADEEIYYRTDHHWTTLGAYYAYRDWAKVNVKQPLGYNINNMTTVTDEFLGTLQSKLNLPMKADSIKTFPMAGLSVVKVTYDYTKETDTLYEDSYLDTKNKYGYFIDDNHGIVEIETKSKSGRELFIIKDSYANTFIPLISGHYSKIYVLDLRYYKGSLFQMMEQYDNGSMEVLLLYNCVHFIDEFLYF